MTAAPNGSRLESPLENHENMGKAAKKTSKEAPGHFRYRSPNIPIAAIRRYALQIAEKFDPEKIILFGSYAYGEPHEWSDVDILVVMPAQPDRPIPADHLRRRSTFRVRSDRTHTPETRARLGGRRLVPSGDSRQRQGSL